MKEAKSTPDMISPRKAMASGKKINTIPSNVKIKKGK